MGGNRRSAYEQQLARAAQTQAEESKKWGELARPYYQQAMQMASEQLQGGFGTLPNYVREAFDTLEGQTTEDYARAGRKARTMQEQAAKQMGLAGVNPNAALLQKGLLEENLAMSQAHALSSLRMQEAMTGLNTTMNLLNMLRGGAAGAAQIQEGLSAQQLSTLQYLMQNGGIDPWGNAIGGAVAGAGAGSSLGPIGAIIGALLGGYMGYRSA
jgi:hypothetical protein